MALTIVALALFLAMVVAWVVLPGSAMVTPAQESSEPLAANAASQTA
ncbi:MAG TPA: hypothetical protein VFU22_33215 [Roseiflexaceae bacterium]|nr:hypothetical protein [Roseiflexaceae bacterium]